MMISWRLDRSEWLFKWMTMRPWFTVLPDDALAPTTVEKSSRTLGSCRTMSVTACWYFDIASNDIPCAASVMAKIAPWSSLGMKPLGMRTKRYAVATKMISDTAIVPGRCRSTDCKLRSYQRSKPSNRRSVAA